MTFSLSQRSENSLKGVDPKLVAVVRKAITITPIDFVVIEGLRSVERQKELVAKGASHTMKSNHLIGRAVDVAALVDGKITWDAQYYHKIAAAFKQAAKELDVPIRWGGDFKGFFDSPHFELL
jgi:peptidoglycan L-alanyl-D-glutamate endopeptidase CwlK